MQLWNTEPEIILWLISSLELARGRILLHSLLPCYRLRQRGFGSTHSTVPKEIPFPWECSRYRWASTCTIRLPPFNQTDGLQRSSSRDTYLAAIRFYPNDSVTGKRDIETLPDSITMAELVEILFDIMRGNGRRLLFYDIKGAASSAQDIQITHRTRGLVNRQWKWPLLRLLMASIPGNATINFLPFIESNIKRYTNEA